MGHLFLALFIIGSVSGISAFIHSYILAEELRGIKKVQERESVRLRRHIEFELGKQLLEKYDYDIFFGTIIFHHDPEEWKEFPDKIIVKGERMSRVRRIEDEGNAIYREDRYIYIEES